MALILYRKERNKWHAIFVYVKNTFARFICE